MAYDKNLILIVAMAKITSAFEDILEIEDEKIYKGLIKKSIKKFQAWYNDYSKGILSLFYENPQNAKFFEKTIGGFDKYDSYYDLGSEKCTRMALAFGKLSSARNDLNKGIGEESFGQDDVLYNIMISANIDKLLKHKYWNQYTSMTDLAGAEINNLIESLDSISEPIYCKPEEEKVSSKS